MRHHNDFFKMTEEEQDIFLLTDNEELDDKVRDFVYAELGFSRDTNDHLEMLEANKILLHYDGIGPNYFMMNEFNWDEKVLRFKNFYDLNEEDHNYQENAWDEDENYEDYVKKPLFSRMNDWARAEIDGEFNYINLFSFPIYVYYALEEAEIDWIDKNVPYDLVPGPNDGKREDAGTLFDMRRDAKGKEGWLEQMQDFARDWISAWYDGCLYDEKWDCVFINDTSGKDFDGDPNKEIIFGSLNILKEIHIKTFIEDCHRLQGDSELIYQFRDNALAELTTALDEKFIEVQKTPPNVVKLKKKMKVVFADGALEDMERIAESEYDNDGD